MTPLQRHLVALGVLPAPPMPPDPRGLAVDAQHAAFRFVMQLVRVDPISADDAFTVVDPGFTPEYPRGAILVSPTAWACASARNLADAYRPEGAPW